MAAVSSAMVATSRCLSHHWVVHCNPHCALLHVSVKQGSDMISIYGVYLSCTQVHISPPCPILPQTPYARYPEPSDHTMLKAQLRPTASQYRNHTSQCEIRPQGSGASLKSI